MKTEYIVIRVTPALKAALERLAAQDRRTLSDYVRLVLEDHVAARPRSPRPVSAEGEGEGER